MMTEWIIAFILGAISFGSFGAWVARQKRRSVAEGLIVGFLFGPLGVLIEALLPQGALVERRSAIAGTGSAEIANNGDSRGPYSATLWPTLGIPMALVAGVLWAISVRACGKVLDDFGSEVPVLSGVLVKYAWLLAVAFAVLTSGCLLSVAASKTSEGAFVSRVIVFLLVTSYALLAVLGCVLPLLKVLSDLS